MSLPQSGERANEIWTPEGTQYWLANLRRNSCRVLLPDIANLDHLPYFANLADTFPLLRRSLLSLREGASKWAALNAAS